MKHKFSLIWRVAVALVLVLSFSLVAAVPVAASPDVSDVWVQLDDYGVGNTGTYHVYFTPGADLAKNVDTITVFFPIDTDPSSAAVEVDGDGDAVAQTAQAATESVAGYRVEAITPVDISAGSEVRLDISGVVNPTSATNPATGTLGYTLNVYTSQETTQVESSTYTIGADKVTGVSAFGPTATDKVAGAAAGVYTVTFTPNNTLAVWDTITVIFPTGTGIPAMAASDVEIDTTPLDSAPMVDGRFVTLTLPVGWDITVGSSNTEAEIDFTADAGITNPTYAHTGYEGKVYTSKDLGIEDAGIPYEILAASISQVVFDAVTSDAEVMVSTATDTRAADLKIQTKDQYGNLKGVPTGVTVTFDLTSSSTTGLFKTNSTWDAVSVGITGTDNFVAFKYKDTTVGTATITAENAAHGWSDTWEIEVTSETEVELWDGDTLVGEYVTIGGAIGDALDGNTIKVGPGTYTPASRLAISQEGLTLESTDGAVSTTIDSTIDGVIYIQADDVTFDGFTVDQTGSTGSAILIRQNADRATVQNNIITGSGCGAIVLEGSMYCGDCGVVSEATISGNIIEDCGCGIQLLDGAKNCTISNNTVTGSKWAFDAAISIEGDNDGNTISGNTLTDNLGSGIMFWGYVGTEVSDNNLVEGNTISGNAKKGIWVVAGTFTPTNLTIIGNDITDNEGVGILINGWTAASDAIKFNTISGNTEYGIKSTVSGVDATHNWWGDASGPSGVGPGSGDAINSDDVDYEPWLVTTVSAGEWATGVTSLDARATVGVKVSGAAGTDQKIGVARYTENPMATPEFTPLTDGFFDVYVEGTTGATEIGIKFYDAAITSDSVVYVWDAFEEVWTECSDQAYNATYGYIWVKVRTAAADVPTVPLISDLAGTPFAISVEEVRTLQSIAVTPATASIGVGGTKQFTATGTYNLAPLTEDITTLVTWASSNLSVATIDAAGLATGVAEGTTNITATLGTIVSEEAVLTVSVFDVYELYDENDNGVIDKTEALTAVADYFADDITKDQALLVIVEYMG